MLFLNRSQAGTALCSLLTPYQKEQVALYALPRGGVIVAEPIARLLHVPLQLLFTRKIGHPFQPEYAIAALSESGILILSPHLADALDPEWLDRQKQEQMAEIQRRKALYAVEGASQDLTGKTAIIVDDGIATGLTLLAGIAEIRRYHPQKILVAVPVCPREAADKISPLVDRLICIEIPASFRGAVGAYYASFPQVTDREVISVLQSLRRIGR